MGIVKNVLKMIKRYTLPPIKYARGLGVTIGENCKLNGSPEWGSEPWLISIGNHVELSGKVIFITHDGATWVFRNQEECKNIIRYGKISIKDNCFVGMRSTIMPGVTIGPNSIVGAGSLVTKNIPEGCVYAGVPAKFICTIEDFKKKCLRETPSYDINYYHSNKREAVLKMLENK